MQISFSLSDSQWSFLRGSFEVVIWPLFAIIGRRTIRILKESINELITENVNRVRQELIEYIEQKFKEHEDREKEQWKNLDNFILERRKTLPQTARWP